VYVVVVGCGFLAYVVVNEPDNLASAVFLVVDGVNTSLTLGPTVFAALTARPSPETSNAPLPIKFNAVVVVSKNPLAPVSFFACVV
jgi:hypothetical protein